MSLMGPAVRHLDSPPPLFGRNWSPIRLKDDAGTVLFRTKGEPHRFSRKFGNIAPAPLSRIRWRRVATWVWGREEKIGREWSFWLLPKSPGMPSRQQGATPAFCNFSMNSGFIFELMLINFEVFRKCTRMIKKARSLINLGTPISFLSQFRWKNVDLQFSTAASLKTRTAKNEVRNKKVGDSLWTRTYHTYSHRSVT